MILPHDISQWRQRLRNRMPENYGQALQDITSVSQAVSLVQAYDVYSEWVTRKFSKEKKEQALRALFPALEEERPRW